MTTFPFTKAYFKLILDDWPLFATASREATSASLHWQAWNNIQKSKFIAVSKIPLSSQVSQHTECCIRTIFMHFIHKFLINLSLTFTFLSIVQFCMETLPDVKSFPGQGSSDGHTVWLILAPRDTDDFIRIPLKMITYIFGWTEIIFNTFFIFEILARLGELFATHEGDIFC